MVQDILILNFPLCFVVVVVMATTAVNFHGMINYVFEVLRQVDPIIANLGGYIQYVHRSVCSLHDLIHELQEDIKDLKAKKAMKTMKGRRLLKAMEKYPQGISDKSVNPIVCAAMFNYGQWSQTPKVH